MSFPAGIYRKLLYFPPQSSNNCPSFSLISFLPCGKRNRVLILISHLQKRKMTPSLNTFFKILQNTNKTKQPPRVWIWDSILVQRSVNIISLLFKHRTECGLCCAFCQYIANSCTSFLLFFRNTKLSREDCGDMFKFWK